MGRLAALFGAARQIHERLLLVVAATIAMLAIAAFGIGMGWPRLRNTLAGWHKGVAWMLLPLLVLSPLTGLLLAFGITFFPAPEPRRGPAPVPLAEAVRLVGESRDLSTVSWIRQQGGRMLARINDAASCASMRWPATASRLSRGTGRGSFTKGLSPPFGEASSTSWCRWRCWGAAFGSGRGDVGRQRGRRTRLPVSLGASAGR